MVLWAWGQIGSSSECLNKGLLTPVHNANVFISSFILPQSTTLTALTQNPSFLRILVDGTQGPALVSYRKGRSRVGHRSCLILDFSKQSFDHGGLSLRHCGRNPCQHLVPLTRIPSLRQSPDSKYKIMKSLLLLGGNFPWFTINALITFFLSFCFVPALSSVAFLSFLLMRLAGSVSCLNAGELHE